MSFDPTPLDALFSNLSICVTLIYYSKGKNGTVEIIICNLNIFLKQKNSTQNYEKNINSYALIIITFGDEVGQRLCCCAKVDVPNLDRTSTRESL